MPITFKLVGNVNSKSLEIKKDITGTIRLSNIISIFVEYGLSSDDFKDIRIIQNSHTIDSEDKIFNVNEGDNVTVFIFCTVKDIREKLAILFLKHSTTVTTQELPTNKFPALLSQASFAPSEGVNTFCNQEVDNLLEKSIEDKVEEEIAPELSEEIINEMNKKTLELFKDDDFCNLIKIYYTKPNLIKTFMNFVSHGDIININIPKVEEAKDYTASIKLIQSLGLDSSEDKINKALTIFNGHINLALRLLLCQKSIQF
jgi:hypothetical protein